jgi:hypothetical protein
MTESCLLFVNFALCPNQLAPPTLYGRVGRRARRGQNISERQATVFGQAGTYSGRLRNFGYVTPSLTAGSSPQGPSHVQAQRRVDGNSRRSRVAASSGAPRGSLHRRELQGPCRLLPRPVTVPTRKGRFPRGPMVAGLLFLRSATPTPFASGSEASHSTRRIGDAAMPGRNGVSLARVGVDPR